MLKVRSIGLSDYAVLDGNQRIGRIRLATVEASRANAQGQTINLDGGRQHGR